MKLLKLLPLAALVCLSIASCDSPAPVVPKLVFKFKFDSTQVRLDNLGNPSSMPANHRGQHPQFNKMSSHYIELAPDMYTALGTGEIVYIAPMIGASQAIDFDQSVKVGENEQFFSIPLSDITPGTYEWLRVSLAYQNYDISFRVNPPVVPATYDGVGTLAAFIGYNTHINTYTINTQQVTVNADKLQGYWGFESLGTVNTGQVPSGAITVPNPLFASSPIPSGSCVVTAAFSQPLVITGNETSDITVTVSLSINKSFEWIESGSNNFYEPLDGDTVVDMGVRGMIPIVTQ